MHELGIYLRKNLPHEYVKEKGYDSILPRKVKEERPSKEREQTSNDLYEYVEDIDQLFQGSIQDVFDEEMTYAEDRDDDAATKFDEDDEKQETDLGKNEPDEDDHDARNINEDDEKQKSELGKNEPASKNKNENKKDLGENEPDEDDHEAKYKSQVKQQSELDNNEPACNSKKDKYDKNDHIIKYAYDDCPLRTERNVDATSLHDDSKLSSNNDARKEEEEVLCENFNTNSKNPQNLHVDATPTRGEERSKEEVICDENINTNNNKPQNKKNKYYWKRVNKVFSNEEKKTLVAESLAIFCKVIMNLHVYSFGGKTMLQEGFGCIGDRAIGVIATLIMIWWCRNLKKKLEEVNIVNELMKIYVDDFNGIFQPVKAGLQYRDGKLVHNVEKEKKDENIPDDKRTMNVVKDIANSIDSMITMTIDVPSKHQDGKVPMLDVKTWINDNNEVFYEFYEKPTKRFCHGNDKENLLFKSRCVSQIT